MKFSVSIYRDYDTGRTRWAVFCGGTSTWYFPKNYGRKSADALCRRMNGAFQGFQQASKQYQYIKG